jgi:hypothetical protein
VTEGGEHDRAARSGWLPYLRVDPRLDPIRADARFATLVQAVGLS